MRPFLISYAVGFYAGLNLIAWFMIFCFVRETKQLTLEEIDRKQNATHFDILSLTLCRGLLGSNEELHFVRAHYLASILHQTTHFPSKDRQATSDYRERRNGRGVGIEGVRRSRVLSIPKSSPMTYCAAVHIDRGGDFEWSHASYAFEAARLGSYA